MLMIMCGSKKYPYPPPPHGGFFPSLTPHPTGFPIPEGFALLPLPPWNFHDFSTFAPIPLGNSKSKKRDLINSF